MNSTLNIGIVGGRGYIAIELLRLLNQHPHITVRTVISRQTGTVGDLHDSLRHCVPIASLPLSQDYAQLIDCQIVFFATPSSIAMQHAPALLEAGIKVIDLSADFRLADPAEWERWYGKAHTAPQWQRAAVYGLPEINRGAIKDAQLIACPGCYPTAIIIGSAPLLQHTTQSRASLMVNAVSGISGAGRSGDPVHSFVECAESFRAYAPTGHRHHAEIIQTMRQFTSSEVQLTFVPYLAPMRRGIHATITTALPHIHQDDIRQWYLDAYHHEPFITTTDHCPSVAEVVGSNRCHLSIYRSNDNIIIFSVLDNLIKGAAGQALQNMNIMYGWPETLSISQ